MIKHYSLVLTLFVLLGGCGLAHPQVTIFTRTYEAKDKDAPIDVFVTTKPDKPYEEIAKIKANHLTDNRNLEDMRRAARSIGADGLILIQPDKTFSLENNTVTERVDYIFNTAIAIRYK